MTERGSVCGVTQPSTLQEKTRKAGIPGRLKREVWDRSSVADRATSCEDEQSALSGQICVDVGGQASRQRKTVG